MQKQEIQNHVEYLLGAALHKCGNLSDAQDITQETMLAALLYLDKGGTMENPRAWLLSVMNRKYYDMLRRKYQLPTVVTGEDMEITDGKDLEKEWIHKEEAEHVRREVAYLAESYRTLIAKHYFHGMSVKEIAEEAGIPEGTVKSRMDFGRKQLKKGFEKMEQYTENSYMPKRLNISWSGTMGMDEEPRTLVEGDALAQNLLILAYEKPVTITELSKAIGVASAYVEPVVNKLVDSELMKRMGDGKVYTDFIIYRGLDFVKYMKEREAFAKEHAAVYTSAVKKAIEELKKTSFYSQRLERFMMIHVASDGLYHSLENVRKPQVFPERPNGGNWIAFGIILEDDPSIFEGKRGEEEYGLAGCRCTKLDKYLQAEELRIYNYETALDPHGWEKHSGYNFNMLQDVEVNMLKLFYLIQNGIAPETVDLDTRMVKGIPLLKERGFLKEQGGEFTVAIPCLTHEEEREFFAIANHATEEFAAGIKEALAAYCETHKKRVPSHLKSVPDQKLTMPYEPNAMMFVFEAIKQGIHPRDLGACPETFVVF